MPIFGLSPRGFKRQKRAEGEWDNFRRGLNTLLKETEIRPDELSQADNIVLVGRGVPTKRWGFKKDFLASDTGVIRALKSYYTSGGTDEVLAIADDGIMVIKNNASYTARTGASWVSGSKPEMAQLNDNMYIVDEDTALVRYSTPDLTPFSSIGTPEGGFATQISGASGTAAYSYRVTTKTIAGETLGATPISLISQPQELSGGAVRITWSAPSAGASVITGFNIYGRKEGDERFIAATEPGNTTFIDDGSVTPDEFSFPPTADSTGGITAKFITRFQDRLIYAGLPDEPSKVVISGRVPLHERNDVSSGGNYIQIEPDAGDDITGIGVFSNRLIIFKSRSIWEITLSSVQVGNFYVTQPSSRLITDSHGCISHRSIQAVENDVFFLSRKGIYVLGVEPNILADVLRTNELSAKIRPDIEDETTTAQKKASSAIYAGTKYIISFPGKDRTYVYDRERLSWVGPWTYDANIYTKFFDSSDDEKFLFGSDSDAKVHELSSDYRDDDGTAITTTLTTRNEDFGDWTLFKFMPNVFSNWRSVSGQVNINIITEDRAGAEVTAKNFTINVSESNSGWGADQWANTQWGDSEESGSTVDVTDIIREAVINKSARRIKIQITTNNRNDNYELLGFRVAATPIGRGLTGSDWKV